MIKAIKDRAKAIGQKAYQHPLITILLVAFLSIFIIYSPFIFHLDSFGGLNYEGKFNFSTVLLNFDSLNYIIAAKTWYNPEKITSLFAGIAQDPTYFPAHLPGYPALIWIIAQLPLIDFPHASILATLIFSLAAPLVFYLLAKSIVSDKKSLILALIFCVFPARWLVLRSVPSPEPLFLTLVMASIYCYRQKRFGWSAIMAGLAQTVKSPGILLIGALGLLTIINILREKLSLKKALGKYWPILLTPLALLLVFGLYYLTTGDFLAYFKTGNNIHLYWPPFQVFNYLEEWVNTIWLEDVVFVYLGGLVALLYLWQKLGWDIAAFFATIFYLSTLFVSHRDISRYLAPTFPFLLIGAEKLLTNKKFLLALVILLPAIFLYTINFISFNTMSVGDWTPYL